MQIIVFIFCAQEEKNEKFANIGMHFLLTPILIGAFFLTDFFRAVLTGLFYREVSIEKSRVFVKEVLVYSHCRKL